MAYCLPCESQVPDLDDHLRREHPAPESWPGGEIGDEDLLSRGWVRLQPGEYILPAPHYAEGGVIASSRWRESDVIPFLLSEPRSTVRRPGETWAQATERLRIGEDL